MTSPVRRLLAWTCGFSLLLGCVLPLTFPVGENANLPCSFLPEQAPDIRLVCWGREVSEYEDECTDEMFRSDGKVIFTRPSGRYHFTGNIAEGDAAMTIMDVNEDDSGYYFCLVKGIGIYQLFNWDVKIEGPPREALAPSSIQTAPTPIMATTPSTANETESETTIVVASTVTPLVLVMLTVAMAATWYIKTRTGSVDFVNPKWTVFGSEIATFSDDVAWNEGGVVLTKFTPLEEGYGPVHIPPGFERDVVVTQL
ncbi:hepatitis A virus cellular receptor 1 homolog [Dunckerocampus dactyliophorus]|uniref:hepatitis A virus cellular receptor 1 homolog n=1 Tax=Dunckerocampus dactyliophorus TaxID=161453 RepID=UPI002405F6AB|nr:hepatitis A virus cellular receptor 1 homolog [Dunckerocampus dactyliophorus]